MQLFQRDNLVWGVFLIGLAGLPFLTMSTERVSWKAFTDAYSDCSALCRQSIARDFSSQNRQRLRSNGDRAPSILPLRRSD